MPTALIIGAGYSVRPLLPHLIRAGWDVIATTRDRQKAKGLTAAGVAPLFWSAPNPFPAEAVNAATLIVISVAPSTEEGGGACPVLAAWPATQTLAGKRVIYLSSTGVYGDYDGQWIDETARCKPETPRGRRRLAAELGWQEEADMRAGTLSICRLAGIYGPGRNAIESLMSDTNGASSGLSQRVIKPGQVFNRIHRDDIVRGLRTMIDATDPPDVINFSDDEPSPPQDVIAYAAALLNIPAPPEVPFDAASLSPMARSFYADNKRLRNNRLKALTGDLLYPTYREGLTALSAQILSVRAGPDA